MIKEVTITELTGDLAMAATLDLPPETYPEAELNGTFDFTDVDSMLVDLYLPPGSSTGLTVGMVVKSTGDWLWCPSSVTTEPASAGTWLTYAVPVSSFASSVDGSPMNPADIRQLVIQFYTNSAAGFRGTVYVDNVRYKKGSAVTVVSDFNKEGSSWSEYESGTEDNLSLSIVPRPENVPVRRIAPPGVTGDVVSMRLRGRKLLVDRSTAMPANVLLLDIRGRISLSSEMRESSHEIDCTGLATGQYMAVVRQKGHSVARRITLY